ncbi:ras-related protein Rab-40C isoform X2 [Elephas maximus indicus]|uniref:ras-related protein Rab-40C isoform X2 n=1 Tax=Elephas maximus indicus TaxID=99487 RepID=UPI002116C4E6|nr:ras-related protein Rab-40C isoform X2 [Elephas maximus indicus]
MVTARRRATGGSAALCGKLRRLCARDGRASGPMAAGGSQWLPGRPGAGPPRSVRHPSAGSPGSARGACGPGLRAHERRMGTQGSPVKSYDYLLKFLLVGDSDVGKGEILESLQDGASESPYAYSNGIDYKTTTILLDGRRVKLELWDTSGQGRFCTIFRSYSRGAQGILLVYDITNRWSFDGIDRWIKEIDEVSPLCNFNVTESFTELSRIVLMRHGMEKIWRPNRVFSLQDLCCRAIVSCTPVHLIDKLPLPVTIKSHLKSFSMANGMNAVMMHGRSYSLAGGGGGGGSKGNSLKRSRCIRPPQSPPQNCSRSNCKIS